MKNHINRLAAFFAIIAAASLCGIVYCETLQFFPLRSKTVCGRLGLVFIGSTILCYFLFHRILENLAARTAKERWAVILSAMIVAVWLLVTLPLPMTGLYPRHTLTLRALPDAQGIVHPVTLTWLHRESGDVSLSQLTCEGNCPDSDIGPTLTETASFLRWSGITGDQVTLEFLSDPEQGIVEIDWDGQKQTAALNNPDMNRLSFDHCFPPADGLPPAVCLFILSFLLGTVLVSFTLYRFPVWTLKKFCLAAFVIFVLFRVLQFRTISEPLGFLDSRSYIGMSEMSVGDILRGTQFCHDDLWYCISRPAFIPLIYKLCHQDSTLISAVQFGISIFSWGYLAGSAALLCKQDILRKILFSLALGLGCVPNVTRWDGVIMSESLSISAAMLLVGSCFRLARPAPERRWHLAPAIAAALSALLYVQSRDSAAWTVLLLAAVLLCLNRLRKERKIIFGLSATLVGICLSVMLNTGGRWQYPFENVLFNRIARDGQAEEFFIEAGMPTPDRIEELYGQEHMMGSALFNSEEMTELREWILSDGLKTYIRYMLRTPLQTLRMARDSFESEGFTRIDYTFSPKGFTSLLPDVLSRFFSMNLPSVLVIFAGIAGVFLAFRIPDGERLILPAMFILSAYIFTSGVLIADEYEIARHSLVILLMMKACIPPLLAQLIERLPHSTLFHPKLYAAILPNETSTADSNASGIRSTLFHSKL